MLRIYSSQKLLLRKTFVFAARVKHIKRKKPLAFLLTASLYWQQPTLAQQRGRTTIGG